MLNIFGLSLYAVSTELVAEGGEALSTRGDRCSCGLTSLTSGGPLGTMCGSRGLAGTGLRTATAPGGTARSQGLSVALGLASCGQPGEEAPGATVRRPLRSAAVSPWRTMRSFSIALASSVRSSSPRRAKATSSSASFECSFHTSAAPWLGPAAQLLVQAARTSATSRADSWRPASMAFASSCRCFSVVFRTSEISRASLADRASMLASHSEPGHLTHLLFCCTQDAGRLQRPGRADSSGPCCDDSPPESVQVAAPASHVGSRTCGLCAFPWMLVAEPLHPSSSLATAARCSWICMRPSRRAPACSSCWRCDSWTRSVSVLTVAGRFSFVTSDKAACWASRQRRSSATSAVRSLRSFSRSWSSSLGAPPSATLWEPPLDAGDVSKKRGASTTCGDAIPDRGPTDPSRARCMPSIGGDGDPGPGSRRPGVSMRPEGDADTDSLGE
mmetsp:Transcript_730/g.2343  ORF Transcript_730/g.2343 Transcript_730/m.2343 type:complete len:444 (+) Transcript_730:255-1586(+)